MLVFVLAVSAALIFSFLCSIFESVLLSLGHAQVESLKNQGRRSGFLMEQYKRDIDIPIAAILIVNTVAHTVGASVAGATYGEVFDESTLWIFTIVFTIAVLLFTEIIPKTLGVTFAHRLAVPVAYGIKAFTIALKPLVLASGVLSRRLRGGVDPGITSIEEIRLLAALGRSEGSVARHIASMIVGATHLQHLQVKSVMVPRTDVTLLSMDHTVDEVISIVKSNRFSRFPVHTAGDQDDVIGIVLAKELLLHLITRQTQTIDWSALVREPLIVPENLLADTLLRRFQNERSHMALVVNEYGAFSGIVTNEDLLEEIVGEMFDESDTYAEELKRVNENLVIALATADVRKVSAFLNLRWLPDEDAATIGGVVVQLLGRLPKKGDRVQWQGFELEVLDANRRRAERIAIRTIKLGSEPDLQDHTPGQE